MSTLYYVHDPMCSWCWAFRPAWQHIVANKPAAITVERVLGGLAPDTDRPMPPPMRDKIRAIWHTIQQRVPGTPFNFDFWEQCRPRRATYPACRAVIAAANQGPEHAEPMILAVQRAYYLQARNPSDEGTLVELAAERGLDPKQFAADLNAPETHQELTRQIAFGRRIGARGFPSLILAHGHTYYYLPYDYRDPAVVLDQLNSLRSISAPT